MPTAQRVHCGVWSREREKGVYWLLGDDPPSAASDYSEPRGPGLRSESAVGERLCDNEGLVLGEEGRQLELGESALVDGGRDLAHTGCQ